MVPALTYNRTVSTTDSIVAVDRWLSTPRGSLLLRAQRQAVDTIVANVFGYHGLQLTLVNEAPNWMRESQIMHRQAAHVGEDGQIAAPILASMEALPWSSDSFDLIVVHHVADVFGPRILPELCRTLDRGGVMCLVGFNPWCRINPGRWFGSAAVPRGLASRDAAGWGFELARAGLEVLLSRGCWDAERTPEDAGVSLRKHVGWMAPAFVVVARKRSRAGTSIRFDRSRRLSPAWGKPTGA